MTLTNLSFLARAIGAVLLIASSGAAFADCTSVDTSRGTLTAKHVASKNETVSGDVDATGCEIGVYIPKGVKNVTVSATVHDANQIGVFNNGNAKIDGSEIYNTGHHDGTVFDPNGGQTGIGAYFFDATGAVSNSNIYDYQKGGIVINGLSSANVTDNLVTGWGTVPFIAQNGIQFGYGARGNAMRNTVTGNWYTGTDWGSTGILVFETGGVTVNGNTVQNSQIGIGIEAWCYFMASADNNQVVNNTVFGSEWGVSIAAYSLSWSTCDASSDNNKVTNNLIDSTGGAGDAGISIGAGPFGGSDTPTADNNKLIRNTIRGFTTDIDQWGDDTSTKVHANVIE